MTWAWNEEARPRLLTGCRPEERRYQDSPRPLGLGDPTCRRKSGAPAIVVDGTGEGLPVSILRGRRQQRQGQHHHLLERIYDACSHTPNQQRVSRQWCDSGEKKWATWVSSEGRGLVANGAGVALTWAGWR